MPKTIERLTVLDLINNEEEIANISTALSNPIRRRIIREIANKHRSVTELSKLLNIPDSTISFHVSILTKVGILNIVETKRRKGNEKFINLGSFDFNINLGVKDIVEDNRKIEKITLSIPVGTFSNVNAKAPCGIANREGTISSSDVPEALYSSNRMTANLIWMACGTIEYKIPLLGFEQKDNHLSIYSKHNIQAIRFTLELCSECPNYDEHYRSDITFWIDDIELGTYESPGDYGGRRGRYTSEAINIGSTQFGNLVLVEIRENGTYINNQKIGIKTIKDLNLGNKKLITLRFGNKTESRNKGGFNLFGSKCGDFDQDIEFTIYYFSSY